MPLFTYKNNHFILKKALKVYHLAGMIAYLRKNLKALYNLQRL